jgi:hypothetical protein
VAKSKIKQEPVETKIEETTDRGAKLQIANTQRKSWLRLFHDSRLLVKFDLQYGDDQFFGELAGGMQFAHSVALQSEYSSSYVEAWTSVCGEETEPTAEMLEVMLRLLLGKPNLELIYVAAAIAEAQPYYGRQTIVFGYLDK